MVRSARSLQRRLGGRIQALRKGRNLTQEALAEQCGISQKYLSELERGEKAPSWDTLVALAHKGLRTKLANLLFGVDEDVDTETREIDEVLAGRPADVRYGVIEGVRMILKANEPKR